MVTEPGHFRVLMKSESATNSSLGIVTVTPLGETATYWPVESDRDIARFSICRVRLAGSADGGKTFLSRQTFVSVINLCILAWPVKFRSSFTAKQKLAQRRISEPNFLSAPESPGTEIGALFFLLVEPRAHQ